MQYCHLHNHTEYSLLDGAGKIEELVKKAANLKMPAVGISDHGNMYGVPKFVLEARKHGIKPIIGSEFYMAGESRFKKGDSRKQGGPNQTYHQILFAKNRTGYHNLIKMSSLSFTEGFFRKPRIDKELLAEHSEGIVATTCCLASEINQYLLNDKADKAEDLFKWYLDIFGEDYYVELQRHGLKDQDRCNATLVEWANKYNVTIIATNDVHYINQEDSYAHDVLLALQTNSDYTDPHRFRFTDDDEQLNPSFYFKSQEEMGVVFCDMPAALENTIEIADKCQFELPLTGELILPTYSVPEEFNSMDAFLKNVTLEGAKKRYGTITSELEERINYELRIIREMKYAGYFLIVQEFTTEARRRGVLVGPGRGSAAGSVVAYCTGITDIDPLKYKLLFERFLNPARISPPDIDIDFDDEGRQEVINFVIEKYGQKSVSQIITYGTMGPKTAIRDVGRVLNVPLAEVNKIAKFIPEEPKATFAKARDSKLNPDGAPGLNEAFDSKDANIANMMKFATTLEGTARHTGIHAAGVIIAPGDISDYVPTAQGASKKVLTTQYDGPMAELAGMLKMDFLGLKTLSIIKTAIKLIKDDKDVEIDIDDIDLEDELTYQLYQKGETVATFQFESAGMRKYLQQLKPVSIEELIAMNALYRPGPMDFIPDFIARKQGKQEIVYPHPSLEPILENTFGIMVFQEQIMEVVKVVAGFGLGEADLLRRAIGKKKMALIEEGKIKFVQGAEKNGVDEKNALEIYDMIERFANYGFNKSHSAAYSVLAFRTAYLKAHFPHEYMAAVLSHNMNDIKKITFFIEECRRMKIAVLPPCVNESKYLFAVNKNSEIRFGMGAIKGIGEGSVNAIIDERYANGVFEDVFDLTSRIPPGNLSKSVLESLVYGGALDAFEGTQRYQYFQTSGESEETMLEKALQYGAKIYAEKHSMQTNLFGEDSAGGFEKPVISSTTPWPLITKLNYEKDVIGFYLSSHPLDRYKIEIEKYATCSISQLDERFRKQAVKIAGIVTKVNERISQKGAKYATVTIEDYSGSIQLMFFNENYAKNMGFLQPDNCILLSGKYDTSFRNQDFFEFQPINRVMEISLLSDLFSNHAKSIVLEFDLDILNTDLVVDLKTVFKNFKGKCPVEINVVDRESKSALRFASRTVLIEPDYELFKSLNELKEKYDYKYQII